jgi:hypothetical protein
MADNIIPDFNTIWASKSPLKLYDFTDAEILEGWNTIGSTPPDRSMFDAWMNRADRKMKWMYDNMFSADAMAGYLFWRFKKSPYFVGERVSLQKEYPTIYLECLVAGETADEDILTLPEGKNVGDTIVDGTVQWVVRQNASTADVDKSVSDHNKSETAHSNLLRVKSLESTENGINYVTQDGNSHSIGFWDSLKKTLTGAFTANGNNNSLFQQLDGIAGLIKKITGEANWYNAPSVSMKQLVAQMNSVAAISEYDVDDPNAWWVKLRGEPGLIIQGILVQDSSGSASFPISFSKTLSFTWGLNEHIGEPRICGVYNLTNTGFTYTQKRQNSNGADPISQRSFCVFWGL